MRILFTTQHKNAISTVLNVENFRRLAEIDGVKYSEFSVDYANHDVILFMGYDPQVNAARGENPEAKIGVVDVRPPTLKEARGADFLVANGPEMTAMGARLFNHSFEYPIYPEVPPRNHAPSGKDRIIICYHGNKAHAVSMFPHVTRALEELSREYPLELRIIYNVESLGPIPDRYLPGADVKTRIVQWHSDVYTQELAEADIGIVPDLTPIHAPEKTKRICAPRDREFGAQATEVLARYKPTSNPGRILAFSQHGIPVVADSFPSAAQIIRNGENGFLANDAFSWYQGLRNLCVDPEYRQTLGQALKEEHAKRYTIEAINRRFVNFCRGLQPRHEAPESLANAQSLFEERDRSDETLKKVIAQKMKKFFP